MRLPEIIIEKLREYFSSKPEVCFALLFGSYAEGRAGSLSDVDIAVYFYPKGDALEWEEPDYFRSDMLDLWKDVENIAGKDTDLIILNTATPLVASSAVRGMPLVIKDYGIFMRFASIIDDEAEDVRYDLLKGIQTGR